MKRRFVTMLATAALVLAGLVTATPAQAGTGTGAGATGATTDSRIALDCDWRPRHTFNPTFVFNPNDCYRTDNGILVMQGDGNFVLYNAAWQPRWSSNTWGWPGAYAVFQDDCNLVVYYYAHPLWDSGTWGFSGCRLILRGDGNLIDA